MTITSYSHHFFYVAVFSPPSLRHTATTATPLHHSPLSPRITARPCHSRHLSSPPPSLHCHHSTTDRSLLKQRQRRSRRRCRSRSRPRHPRPHHHNRRQLRRHGSCRRFTAASAAAKLPSHLHRRCLFIATHDPLFFTAHQLFCSPQAPLVTSITSPLPLSANSFTSGSVRILAARLCAVTSMLPSPPAIPGCRPVTLTADASVVATKVARSRVCHS